MEMVLGLSILLSIAAHLLIRLYKTRLALKGRLPLPPGPPTLPLVGNLFDIPKTTPWVGYRDMSSKYGNLMCLRALGQKMIVIGDAQTAADLLEKRSANYADRPDLKMVELTGWDWNFVFAGYGQWWRERRRVLWQHVRPNAIHRYRERQRDGVQRLLTGLLTNPEKLQEHLRYSLMVIVLGSIYGMDIAKEDPHIATFGKGLEVVEFLTSNSSWIKYMPSVVRVPTWMPGAAVLRRVAEIREAASSIRNTPWDHCKDALRTGNGQDCIAYRILARFSPSDEATAVQEGLARDALGAAYAAAIDSQFATLQRLFVAMSLYPDIQKKAQAELDRVVGRNRMPEAEDRDCLPYIDAVVKETLRWNTAVPLGVARCASVDDEYNGFWIPRGATVIVNAWAMLHDEKIYPDPERFSPERYLKDGLLDSAVMDPASVIFGMGRRICPGRYFAYTTMFVLIASVLHSFEISPRLDDYGRPILDRPRPTTGDISHLEDWWQCTVKPRLSETEKLIQDMV